MDPTSFAAAFLLSREPVPQTKMVPRHDAVATAPAEVAPEPAPAPPGPIPKVILPGVPIGPFPAPGAIQEAQKAKPNTEVRLEHEPDLQPKHSKRSEHPITTDNPAVLRLSVPKFVPTAWMLVDRFGTTWTHPDKTYLERFVAGRNATVLVPYYSSVQGGLNCVGGSCTSGRCVR